VRLRWGAVPGVVRARGGVKLTARFRATSRHSLSALAPIFAVAVATHQPRYALLTGLATAIGTGTGMAFSGGLSDTGRPDRRGSP
jgi:hypothetical protein